MLKVTQEKGAAVLAALAERLTQFDFLGVCGDPGVTAALHCKALPNLQLVEPVSDVDQLLQKVHVVLAPSIWCEAFGMVVVDALLRGVPVLASGTGGLPEAALGAAQLLPIDGIQLPLVVAAGAGTSASVAGADDGGDGAEAGAGAAGGGSDGTASAAAPLWSQRILPGAHQQPVATWASCLRSLLTDAQAYAAASRTGRGAAADWMEGSAQELRSVLEWMQHRLSNPGLLPASD
jgi:hypothetical protein